jgi:hypothetical protein
MTTSRHFDLFAMPQAPLANLRRRVEYQERALEQARSDLTAERARKGLQVEDDDREDDGNAARWRRQGALDERARILAILTNPIAARQPHLADTFAFKSDIPAAEAIAAMEAQAPRADATQRSAKATADLIELAGKRARGEVPCAVTAGPKRFVRMTPEAIIAAARKAHGQD